MRKFWRLWFSACTAGLSVSVVFVLFVLVGKWDINAIAVVSITMALVGGSIVSFRQKREGPQVPIEETIERNWRVASFGIPWLVMRLLKRKPS